MTVSRKTSCIIWQQWLKKIYTNKKILYTKYLKNFIESTKTKPIKKLYGNSAEII